MSASLEADAPFEPGVESFSVWGTSALVMTMDANALGAARKILDGVLAEVEQAASRFREGTEILSLNAAAGMGPVVVTPMLFDLVAHAIFAANLSDGACDPTVADSLLALGYDQDFDSLGNAELQSRALGPVSPAPGVSGIVLDESASTISLPSNVHLDLGSTAKARAADLAAAAIYEQTGSGCLVDLGGDLRICGPVPVGGWAIGIVESTRTHSDDDVQETIGVNGGGVASSSNAVRHWKRGDQDLHHVIDPATGWPAKRIFRLITVAAPTCVEANALSTAALVWGEDALFELPQRSIAARLVREDGTVERVGGWPEPIKE